MSERDVQKKNSVNLVKVGVYRNGQWNRVMGTEEGVRMIKNDYLQTFSLNRSVVIGEAMRIRLKLSNESANSGFAKDKVAHVWHWN